MYVSSKLPCVFIVNKVTWFFHRCEASTMELAPRTKELYKKLYKNEFPSIKMSPFNAESNSASNGDTFVHGKTIGKISFEFFSSIHTRIGEK
jgi:hypothetical protein